MAQMAGEMLQKAREVVGLSYDEAAARLGRDSDWLIRVETGFVLADPAEVARILVEYGVREARVADSIIDMARRAASPPPWLAQHTPRLSAAARDVLLAEAEATLAQVNGFRLVPALLQTEGYFRAIAPRIPAGADVDRDWELLSCRQAHQPAGVTRLLEAIIDESAFMLRLKQPGVMAAQIRHLLDLMDGPQTRIRVVPFDAPIWEDRAYQFDVLSFAGTTDRIGVCYTILGTSLATGDLYSLWARIDSDLAADAAGSRAIMERYLADLD